MRLQAEPGGLGSEGAQIEGGSGSEEGPAGFVSRRTSKSIFFERPNHLSCLGWCRDISGSVGVYRPSAVVHVKHCIENNMGKCWENKL